MLVRGAFSRDTPFARYKWRACSHASIVTSCSHASHSSMGRALRPVVLKVRVRLAVKPEFFQVLFQPHDWLRIIFTIMFHQFSL